jgi:hypothetical protein
MERRALATFVAPVQQQFAAEQASRNDRAFAFLLVSGLTLFALAVNGYHPFAEDGGLYLAGVKRLLDPALYPASVDFVMEPTRLSLFAPMVAGFVRLARLIHLGLPATLLALHLASIWATLFAAWMLASRCCAKRTARAGAVALLGCWLALPVAGTALVLMDPYLTARSISTPCTILALVGALDMTGTRTKRRRGFALWLGSIALAAAMHPLMAAYAFGSTLMLICLRSARRETRIGATVALSAAALSLSAFLQHIAVSETADYVRIAMTRTYWFPASWNWYELLGLAAPLVVLGVFARPQTEWQRFEPSHARRSLATMAIAAGATAWLVASLFSSAASATHLVARMQPLRAFQTVYLVMVLALGAKLGESILRSKPWRWAALMILLGGIMFAAERSAFPNSSHIEFPSKAPRNLSRNLWTQAFLWIRNNTPRDALFALDADYINASGEDAQCFRAIAERSSLPDYSKDGGEASIAPELTEPWKQGQAAQQALSESPDNQRLAALSRIGVTWVVLKAGAATSFVCPYSNAAVKVCRLLP